MFRGLRIDIYKKESKILMDWKFINNRVTYFQVAIAIEKNHLL